jgi:hypothetical protein
MVRQTTRTVTIGTGTTAMNLQPGRETGLNSEYNTAS